ncbi:cytochrome c maturation protein CcmE [Candidatus Tisiphia endosymbiont of Neophilaenus lineatus]|uniref:cytochrome c maturation protein CcmE n=1 Tax=Candidatus Tisiphia endosymbiont of Neophilaenus lineatus TaxID=3139336 RepID=UPI0035CB289C
MQKKVKNRLKFILFYLLCSAGGIYMILYNLEDSVVFFYPPSKINESKLGKELRVGGLVKVGSIRKITADKVHFVITDDIKDLEISYQGVLPALFRENQGIVAVGKLSGNIFIARELLTKHDENYSPASPNVVKRQTG